MKIETKGENTLLLADCIRTLAICIEGVEKMEIELETIKSEQEEEK